MQEEDTIRDRAYALWVEAGSPDGRDQEFWHRAERELAEESDTDISAENSKVKRAPTIAGGVPH